MDTTAAELASEATVNQYRVLYPLLDASDNRGVKETLQSIAKKQPVRDLTHPERVALVLAPHDLDAVADRDLGVRAEQLEVVIEILKRHEKKEPLSAVGLHLFWTLYTGVLAFWANDKSPHQEDTLALLDQSMRMFVNWIDED